MYRENLEVKKSALNDTYDTKCKVRYKLLNKNLNPPRGDEVVLEKGLNSVTVHTPVVCNSGVRDEYAKSQQLGTRDNDRMELILGREGMIKFMTKV